MTRPLEPPRAFGAPPLRGRIRVQAEDFQVIEELGFEPAGEGEHAWLWVRKRSANTDWVARQLAAYAGVPPSAVSYAGLKDRHAVTEQWFSVHLPGRPDPDWSALALEGVAVLRATRHRRKLKRGALAGNRFRLVVREFEGPRDALPGRLAQAAQRGVPNYFGEQRFGHANLQRAAALFRGELQVCDRHQRGLYLSAARAELFNRVLARRVEQGSWDRLLPGELAMLDGSRSVFLVEHADDELQRRLLEMDLHPSGPLWGRGEPATRDEVLALERAVAAELPLFAAGLAAAGLEQERRALRLPVREAALE
ncbi:MAG TPA: tRNA pseudouridine(13) synthase TruD, partial [Candidatus Competibacteraceae bacterium]|nr:tRNA pseudouridine(13) synthase TruD [Candidatus Competibacteraceae bacterium]